MNATLKRNSPEDFEEDLQALGDLVERHLGIDVSQRHSGELWDVLSLLTREKGLRPGEFLRTLKFQGLSGEILELLAKHFTVGETYFFREPRTLEAVERKILASPELMKKKDPLRIWCAGCSTGEEPYTLAMILRTRYFRQWADRFSLLGTDINPKALQTARKGEYGEWSFRNMSPGKRHIFFDSLGEGRYRLKPSYRQGVDFKLLNLAAPFWCLWDDGIPPRVIFCRNVLIYFSPSQRQRILRRFYSMLPAPGWLVTAPCEAPGLSEFSFVPVSCGGATIYKKEASWPSPSSSCPRSSWAARSAPLLAQPFRESRKPELEIPLSPLPLVSGEKKGDKADLEIPRELANRGELREALNHLKALEAQYPEDSRILYLEGIIHIEMGEEQQARRALRSALFLNPECVLAHYISGTLAMKQGRVPEAARHFRNTREILETMDPETPLPLGEGLTPGELLKDPNISPGDSGRRESDG